MRVKLLLAGEAPPGLGASLLAALPAPFAGGAEELLAVDIRTCTDRRRRQVDAACLLAVVPEPPEGWAHLCIVGSDLCLPAVTHVFGLAELGSRRGVVSWARLREEDEPWTLGPVTRRRLLVEAVHELGHALGLPHCAVPDCAMHRSLWIESIDLKLPAYCPSCLAALATKAAASSARLTACEATHTMSGGGNAT
ncbi:MAG TPA: archaemetzincin [Thermoanaerobaculaceae bacterium]|nr:archaemetzincin [Thermoanaerobaculaceae bacterium]HRS17074.1 archaemetzincin [Thermoanaerobaculaceae bacterium]